MVLAEPKKWRARQKNFPRRLAPEVCPAPRLRIRSGVTAKVNIYRVALGSQNKSRECPFIQLSHLLPSINQPINQNGFQ